MTEIHAVRGLKGKYHASKDGEWFDGGRRLTLCNKGISPNYIQDDLYKVECEKCKALLKQMAEPKFERYNKYLVLKWDDIIKYLSEEERRKLSFLTETIAIGREQEGKKDNTYVVVNEDVPFAEHVWWLIEQYEIFKQKVKDD